jgi:hypothetical protein
VGAERNYSCYGENELGEGGGGFCLTGAELWKTFAAVDSNSNRGRRPPPLGAVCHERFLRLLPVKPVIRARIPKWCR